MFYWIEAQSTGAIAVLVFVLCYLLAAVAFGLAVMLGRRPVGEELKTISPVTLTPLAVILGLLIAFLASRVWDNAGQAHVYVVHEAGALSKAAVFVDALPKEVRVKFREAVKRHIEFIEKEDWPAMANRSADPHRESALHDAVNELLAYTPAAVNELMAQRQVVEAIEQALDGRRNRIRISQAEIAPIQWTVIILLAAMILVIMALIHIGRPAAMATTLFIFSSAVATCLVLLLAYDQPFGPGGVSVAPKTYQGIPLE
jgi:hypothetical protein